MGRVAILALVFAALAAACGSPAPEGPPSVGNVSLRVTGGIAGWDRTVTVTRDGAVTYVVVHGPSPTAVVQRIDAATLARLHELVSDARFAALDADYPPPPGGADLQTYTVTAEVDGRVLTVTTADGAAAPQVLRDVIAILGGALAKAGS